MMLNLVIIFSSTFQTGSVRESPEFELKLQVYNPTLSGLYKTWFPNSRFWRNRKFLPGVFENIKNQTDAFGQNLRVKIVN